MYHVVLKFNEVEINRYDWANINTIVTQSGRHVELSLSPYIAKQFGICQDCLLPNDPGERGCFCKDGKKKANNYDARDFKRAAAISFQERAAKRRLALRTAAPAPGGGSAADAALGQEESRDPR